MKSTFSVFVVAIVLLTAAPLGAQGPPPAPSSPGGPKETPLVEAMTKVFDTFDKPLHPSVESVAPGGGVTGGIGYDFPPRGRWQTTTKAAVTVKRYWIAEVDTAYRGDRTDMAVYARLRDMPGLDFFGPGMNSEPDNQTTFGLREPIAGGLASVRIVPWLMIGGRVEELWPAVSRGRSSRLPSIEERFDEQDAPGLATEPRFGRYQVFVDLVAPAGVGAALHQGGRYRIAYAMFDDQNLDRFTFRRLDLEAQQKFALFGRYRRLTLHGWASLSQPDAGQDVPFYLQHTLGGTGNLRGVRDDLIGSDGSEGTLRGFRNYRFRDRNLLLLQAEYRWSVWGPIEATVFADAGKVTSRRADINLSDLKRNYGFSLSAMRGGGTIGRMDVGFGGGEGTRVFLGLGREFMQRRSIRRADER